MLLLNTNRKSLTNVPVVLKRGLVLINDVAHRSATSKSSHTSTCAGMPSGSLEMPPRFAVRPGTESVAVTARPTYAAIYCRDARWSAPASRPRQVQADPASATPAAGPLWAALVLSRLGRS